MVRVDRVLEDAPWSPDGRTESVVDGGSTTIAVVRPEPGPIEIRLTLPPGVEPPELTLLQVVAPDNRLRGDLSTYAFEVLR